LASFLERSAGDDEGEAGGRCHVKHRQACIMFKNVLQPRQEGVLGLLTKSGILHGFYMAGGTAAAAQLGHRQSDDFDFFCETEFSSSELLEQLNSLGQKITVSGQTRGSLHVVLGGVKIRGSL
jgi:hypothetical protein